MTKSAMLAMAGYIAITTLTIAAMATAVSASADDAGHARQQRRNLMRACVTGANFEIDGTTYTCDPQGARP